MRTCVSMLAAALAGLLVCALAAQAPKRDPPTKPPTLAERAAPRPLDVADLPGRQVAQDVAEHVLRDEHVEGVRCRTRYRAAAPT